MAAPPDRGGLTSEATLWLTSQLRQDLDQFAFLLGGNDGEPLFGP